MITPLTSIKAITFDCYGTLINWPRGIVDAFRPTLHRNGIDFDTQQLLSIYALHERRIQHLEYRSYREILIEVARECFGQFGVEADEECVIRNLPNWRTFPDVVPSLRALAPHYPLVIVSNIDDDLMASTLEHLEQGFRFADVVTAEQVRSYKPRLTHFKEALRRISYEPGEVLHVAESRYHDVAPANELGFITAWVNRGSSASGPGSSEPDLEVKSIESIVRCLT